MTGNDLISKFKLKYDITSALGSPGFTSSEILEFLNVAQSRYINKVYSSHNPYREKFEDTIKSINDLSRLIVENAITLGINHSNLVSSVSTSTPTDYMHYLDCEVVLGAARHRVKLIKYNQLNSFIATDTNQPWIETPVAVLDGDLDGTTRKTGITIAYDNIIYTSTPTVGYLTYIKTPTTVAATTDVITDFADYAYDNIVDEAVNQAIKITEPELYQIDEVETKDNQ